jgi:hypothetical protein
MAGEMESWIGSGYPKRCSQSSRTRDRRLERNHSGPVPRIPAAVLSVTDHPESAWLGVHPIGPRRQQRDCAALSRVVITPHAGSGARFENNRLTGVSPRIESVLHTATLLHGIDHGVESRPFVMVVTSVWTDKRPILFLEQYLFALITSLHTFTSHTALTSATAGTFRHLRYQLQAISAHPCVARHQITAKSRPIQHIVCIRLTSNNMRCC